MVPSRPVGASTSHLLAVLAALAAVPALALEAQSSPSHPKVCAEGVRKYAALSEVPTPYDTLVMPRGEPIRVSSPAEERQAELTMLGRAGSVGATGVVVVDKVEDDGQRRMMQRTTTPVFVASDTARAYAACRKSS
jgi:hypothetical protein